MVVPTVVPNIDRRIRDSQHTDGHLTSRPKSRKPLSLLVIGDTLSYNEEVGCFEA